MEQKEFKSVWDAIEPVPEAAAELKRRAELMHLLASFVADAELSPTQIAEFFDITNSQAIDFICSRFNKFDLQSLNKMAAVAGLDIDPSN